MRPRPPMPPKIHPCLCGFTTDTYPKMRYHRRKCEVWKNRPDPKELTKRRRATHRRERKTKGKCPHCGNRMGRHDPDCRDSLEEKTRRELLRRHGIDPEWWEVFLKVLAQQYET